MRECESIHLSPLRAVTAIRRVYTCRYLFLLRTITDDGGPVTSTATCGVFSFPRAHLRLCSMTTFFSAHTLPAYTWRSLRYTHIVFSLPGASTLRSGAIDVHIERSACMRTAEVCVQGSHSCRNTCGVSASGRRLRRLHETISLLHIVAAVPRRDAARRSASRCRHCHGLRLLRCELRAMSSGGPLVWYVLSFTATFCKLGLSWRHAHVGCNVHAGPSSSAGTVQCSAMLAPTVSAVLRISTAPALSLPCRHFDP
jgi:hypothetical protein